MICSRTSAAERQTRMIWESYQLVLGGLVAVQEQNMKLARYSIGMLLKGAERQREAFRSMFDESFRTYMGFLYPLVSSPRNGSSIGESDLPIEDYDQRTAEKKSHNRATLIERFDRSLVRSGAAN
jgi:hypothetical protein